MFDKPDCRLVNREHRKRKIAQQRIEVILTKTFKIDIGFSIKKIKYNVCNGFEPAIFKFAYLLRYPFDTFNRYALKILSTVN